MVKLFTPNKAIAFIIFSPVVYWVLAVLFEGPLLRDIFNSLAFGVASMIVVTWMSAAYKAVRENVDAGEWQLILAIFLLWLVVCVQRVYSALYNYVDKPSQEFLSQSAIPGFFPYSFMISGALFLIAPEVRSEALNIKAFWALLTGVGIGALIAGILIGYSISTGY